MTIAPPGPQAGSPLIIDDAQLFNDRLQEWQDFYNYHRPHGSPGGQTPYERLLQKTTTTPAPEVNDLPQSHSRTSSRDRHTRHCPPSGDARHSSAS